MLRKEVIIYDWHHLAKLSIIEDKARTMMNKGTLINQLFYKQRRGMNKTTNLRKRLKQPFIYFLVIGVLIIALITTLLFVLPHSKNNVTSENPSSDISHVENARPIITASLPFIYDVYGFSISAGFDRSKTYMSTELKTQLEANEGKDVLYRVAVDVFSGDETYSSDSDRVNFVRNLPYKSIASISEFPEFKCQYYLIKDSFVMKLTAIEINSLVERGGYYLRLLPSERKEGFDRKISDRLTTVLDDVADDELLEIAAICIIDKENSFARKSGLAVNKNFNSDLFEIFHTSPYTFVNNGQLSDNADARVQYNTLVDEYVNGVIEELNLTEKVILKNNTEINGIDSSRFDYYKQTYTDQRFKNEISAGFIVNVTKSELFALVKSEKIKAVYSMKYDKQTIQDFELIE